MSNIEKNLLESVKYINKLNKYHKEKRAAITYNYQELKLNVFENGNIIFFGYGKTYTNVKVLNSAFLKCPHEEILNVCKMENRYFYIYKSIGKIVHHRSTSENILNYIDEKEENVKLLSLNFFSEKTCNFSKCGKLCIFFDGEFLNLFDVHTKNIKKIFVFKLMNCVLRKLSPVKISIDNSLIIFLYDCNIYIWNLVTDKLENFEIDKCINFHIKENKTIIFVCRDGNIYKYKNGEINKINYIKQINKNLYMNCDFLYDGKVLCITTNHREQKNKILFVDIENEKDFKKLEFKFLEYCISPDLKYFVKLTNQGIELVNISFLKNKELEKKEFLIGLNLSNKDTSLNIFSNHPTFDRNVLNLIFDFIPYF